MGEHWLYELPDVVLGAGLELDVWPGWENRSRSSGGYDQVWAVFVHHTASSATPDDDRAYMWNNADDRPIGALYLARNGVVTVGAAGATNCQGKGGPWSTSSGTVPADKGNVYGIAVEAANNGVGEPWPAAQTAAYLALVDALCSRYGLDPARDVVAHAEYAAGRKVDPAGPSPWATGSNTWDMDAFRADVRDAGNEDDMPLSDDDVERVAQRAAELVWAQHVSVPDQGTKPFGWVVGQGYTLDLRAVKASEEAAANTRNG